MDVNKLKRLRAIAYRILPVCGICKHGCFQPHSQWGTCSQHQYEHLKHSESGRQLSIHRAGSRSDFHMEEREGQILHAFSEFLSTPEGK